MGLLPVPRKDSKLEPHVQSGHMGGWMADVAAVEGHPGDRQCCESEHPLLIPLGMTLQYSDRYDEPAATDVGAVQFQHLHAVFGY